MSAEGVVVRKARKDDCAGIMNLIRELAEFEKMPDQIAITKETLERDGFESADPWFHCFVAEDPGVGLVGYMLFYYTYSTWDGRQAYLEDLYIKPSYRKSGVASRMLKSLAQELLARGCSRLNFSVLNWNETAIDFYVKRGAVDLTRDEAWHVFRFRKPNLEELASKE